MGIYQKIKKLNLPRDKYVVCTGSALEGYGIRESGDIDLAVTKDVYQHLKKQGWKEKIWSNGFKRLKKENYEVAINFNCGGYQATTKHLIETANVRNCVPLMSLKEVIKFKKARDTKKDKCDIKLIEKYLQFQK